MQTGNAPSEAMERFIQRYPVRTAAEFEPAQLTRWVWDEEIFSFYYAGRDWFRALQFNAGRERLPIMQRLPPLLTTRFPNWQTALFPSNNRLPGRRRPVDLLISQPGNVWQAARTATAPKSCSQAAQALRTFLTFDSSTPDPDTAVQKNHTVSQQQAIFFILLFSCL